MDRLEEMLQKRLQFLQSDIEAGAFSSKEELEQEIIRNSNILDTVAAMNGIPKADAEQYIQEYFVSQAMNSFINLKERPNDYLLEETQAKIEELIANGNLQEAQDRIDRMNELLQDPEKVQAAISEGIFRQEDADYFQSMIPKFQEDMEAYRSTKEKPGFVSRLLGGIAFVATGKNPYDNQKIKVQKQKASEDDDTKALSERLKGFVSKNKGKIALALGATVLISGLALHGLHNQANEPDPASYSQEQMQDDSIEMATFEVDEDHIFNVNDEQTHIDNLQLLAKAFMERGVQVVSEEECMRLSNEGKLAVSPQQLNNWYISINLEDMDDLTFTKLLADSDTDKEELSSDFARVSNILGSIYTTREETPFIYQFIGNKEYSEYIKSYESAIIQNQKGNKDDLINLIRSRVVNPVAGTSSGPIGMLSTSLIYQQANVYNAQIIGQDIMDLYNINNDCKTEIKTTFYSDDWAEYMRKVNSKFAAAIAYTGSEEDAFQDYLKTLSDEQDDNKVYIEDQVLPYLEKENVQLGEWDLIDEIANNRTVNYQGTGTSKQDSTVTITAPTKTETTKVVPKEPTTPAEKEVQEKVEQELEEQNRESFEDTVNDYAEDHGGKVEETPDGDLIIHIPGEEDIVVDGDTMGAYDPDKDYQGPTYDDYDDYKEDNKDKVEHVDGVGDVVVEDEDITITNPNVHEDKDGNIIDNTTGDKVIIGTEDEIDDYLDDHPNVGEWETVDEGEIHYSDVDNELPPILGDTSYDKPEDNNTSTGNNNGEYDQSAGESNTNNDIPDGVDEDIYNSLTDEEKQALEDMLNAGKEPEAGEIVDETFSDVVYGSYTVPQLMSNLALCANIPESILKNDFPEIWNMYQNWLEEQRLAAEEAEKQQAVEEVVEAPVQEEIAPEANAAPIVEEPTAPAVEEQKAPVEETVAPVVEQPTAPVEEVQVETVSDIAAQKAALEAVRAELTGSSIVNEPEVKTLS